MSRAATDTPAPWRYLVQESVLLLLFAFVLLLGGGYSGLVLAPLRLVNAVLIGLVGAVWLAQRLVRRRPFPRTPLDLPLLGYLAVFAITAAFSMDPRRSFSELWRLGLYVLLFYLLVDLLRDGWPAELFVKVVLIVGAIVLGFALWHLVRWYAAWHAIWGWARPIPTITVRVRSIIGHSNWLAAFINLLWPLALFRLVEAKRWVPRALLTGWLVTAAVALYFTSSRGAWLGTMGGIGAIVLLGLDLERLKRWVVADRWRLILGLLATLALTAVLGVLLVRQMSHPTHGGIVSSRRGFWAPAWSAFRSSPLLGTGPFTYGETFLEAHSIPPTSLFGVAHSYPINLAAESGLLALAALAWMTVVLVRTLWRAWRSSSDGAEGFSLGAFAALIATAVHSQFDSTVSVPYVSVLVALVLALLMRNQRPRRRRADGGHAAAWALAIGWACLLVAAAGTLGASLAHSKGVAAANAGAWAEASRYLDRAAARDPRLATYQLQAGYAHGVRAAESPEELPEAIARYQAGVRRSPNYALNSANLSILLWTAGEWDSALAWMERAAKQAPASALVHLNLGRLHEEVRQEDQARTHYETALSRAPDLADAFFWRATPLRAAFKQAWLEDRPVPEPVETPTSASEWYRSGVRALAEERPQEAFDALRRAVSLNPHYAPAYVAQAEAAVALGRDEEAERLLRTALLAEGGQEIDHVRARFALARLYHRQGRLERAIEIGEETVTLARRPSTHLPGQLGNVDYAWYLFHAEAIEAGLLPQLAVITVTDEVAEWMLQLGAWHEEAGDAEAARQIYRHVLDEVPDLEEARRRLEALE